MQGFACVKLNALSEHAHKLDTMIATNTAQHELIKALNLG